MKFFYLRVFFISEYNDFRCNVQSIDQILLFYDIVSVVCRVVGRTVG